VGQKSGWERWRALLEAPECRLRESVRSRGTGFLTTCLSVRGVELAAFVRWRSRAVEGEQRPEIARRCDRVNCRARRLVRVGPLTKAAGDARNDALDGLRLLAVAAVLAFHYGVPGGQAGFLGVDVFFVLSGYLITSLMLSQLRHGRVRLGEFWTRRARRLVPALVPVVGATLLWGAVFAPAVLRDRLRGDIASTLFYFANWHFISSNTYFASDGVRSPLEHMWSLAVEEQFYLVWPLLLALVARPGGSKACGAEVSIEPTSAPTAVCSNRSPVLFSPSCSHPSGCRAWPPVHTGHSLSPARRPGAGG